MQRALFILSLLFISYYSSFSQCGSFVNTFPYNESFEAGPSGWTSGGTNNDWAWGTPSKNFIQTAGSGTKCWMTGGTSGFFYSYGQRSYVTSPCFDFTNIQNPHVKVKVYWEGENQYDGTIFQYSLNSGTTWNNVGTSADPINCLNENWYNQSNINALNTLANPKPGWAGTILPTSGGCFGGNGSGGWVIAQHCMSNLAGEPNVQFRFAFGAGTICNDFDGFAFDDITIGEAPANNANFAYACNATQLGYQFTNTSALCPSVFSWNFGDPISGASNTSTIANPIHVFSSPGTYNVTLTVSGPCNQPSTIIQSITTINSTLTAINPTCNNASNGSITTIVSGGIGAINQLLQPGGTSNVSGFFNNLNANTFTVTTSDATGCSITESITLINPTSISWTNVTSIPITCNGNQNGQITATANGGTGVLSYTLNPGNNTNTSGLFTSLNIGTYTIVVSDANNCSLSTIVSIVQPNPLLINTVNTSNINCFNAQNGIINVISTGGTGILNYTLNPGALSNTTGLFNNLNIGTYTIVVSDVNNCTASSTTTITQPTQIIINSINVKQPSCNPTNNGEVTVIANGGTGTLLYSIGGIFSTSNTIGSMTSNTYTITVKDANNCTTTSSVTLLNPNAPSIQSTTASNVTCHGLNDGTISVSATSNSTIDTYTLSPTNQVSSDGNFNSLSGSIYTITVVDINGCSNTTVMQVLEPEKMVVSNIKYISNGCGQDLVGTLQIDCIGGTGIKTFTLSPNATSNSTGLFQINQTGEYTYQIYDQNNCFLTGKYFIPEIACCENVFVPNAFSPNNDLRNDEFKIINPFGIDLKKFIVYNRWGQAVFTAQNINDSWDGNTKGVEATIGTYFYLIQYTCLSTGKEYTLKGDIFLIR